MHSRANVEFWMKAAALVAALGGILLRVHRAATLGLNFDETLQLLAVHSPSAYIALKRFSTFAHPPVHLLLTYLVRPLTLDELGARTISLLAAAVLPVALYLWLRDRAGLVAACTAVVVASLSWPLINLSVQVRSYGLAMLFFALTLLFFDHAAGSGRRLTMLPCAASLVLAIGADYSVALVCPALTLYGFARLHELRAPRRAWVDWSLVVAGALLAFAALYWTHLRHFDGTPSSYGETWLRDGFRAPGESLLHYFAFAPFKQFVYFAGGWLGGLLLLAACALALPALSLSWRLLLLTPFVTGVLLCLVRLFPFGQTRHSSLLAVVITTGVALSAQHFLAARSRGWLLLVPALALFCFFVALPQPGDWADAALDPAAFRATAHHVKELNDSGAAVIVSAECAEVLKYYSLMLGLPLPVMSSGGLEPLDMNLIAATAAGLRSQPDRRPGAPVYVVESGAHSMRDTPLARNEVTRTFARFRVWRLAEPVTP